MSALSKRRHVAALQIRRSAPLTTQDSLAARAPSATAARRPACQLLLAAFGPITLIGLALMLYNYLRFDNPLEFGQRYQLPVTPHEQFHLVYFWSNFKTCFLNPARWHSPFPFVRAEDRPFGVLLNAPVVWLALATLLAWIGSSKAPSMLLWFLASAMLMFGGAIVTLLFHDSMCLRYGVEYAHAVVFLSVVGMLRLDQAALSRPAWRRLAHCLWGLLAALSVGFNLLRCVALEPYVDYDIGFVLLYRGQAAQAIPHLRKLVDAEPANAMAHNTLAMALSGDGQLDEAIVHYQKALELDPLFVMVHYHYGIALARQGRLDEAVAHFRTALAIQPDSADFYNGLGHVLQTSGRMNEGIACFQKALQLQPAHAEANFNLGNALLQQGRIPEAIASFQRALSSQPNLAEARNNLGKALLVQGRLAEAVEEWKRTLDLQPDNTLARNNLAWVLATAPDDSVRNGTLAVQLAKRSVELTAGANPDCLGTLAAAYAEAGMNSEAVKTAEAALELVAPQTNSPLASILRSQLVLHRAGLPYRDATLGKKDASHVQPGGEERP